MTTSPAPEKAHVVPGKGTAGRGKGTAGRGDQALEALEELMATLERLVQHEKVLTQRIIEARKLRLDGTSWHDVLAEEDQPNTIQLMSQMLAQLSAASGKLRRALVLSLRADGVTIPAIAKLFGVTHQRVSNLLHRSGT